MLRLRPPDLPRNGVPVSSTGVSGWTLSALDDFARRSGVKVDRGVRARQLAASDWGGLVFGKPAAVVRPHDADELAAAVAYANERGLKLTPRATGASAGGQTVADGTVTLDLTGLDSVVVDPSGRTAACGSGASWRSALFAALAYNLQPHVMPLHLDLTVGGVISVGGFGAIGHRFGLAASHATQLEIVTGDGRSLTCDTGSHRDLFDAARGGLGRCGVITRARLALRDAPAHVRVIRWQSSSVEAWANSLLALSEAWGDDAASNVVHVEGFCRRENQRLVCELQIGVETDHSDQVPPELLALPADVAAEVLSSEDRSLASYAARFDPRFEEMVAAGYVNRAHPWVESLLAPEAFIEVLPEIILGMAGEAGDRIQVVLVRTDKLPPLVVAPPQRISLCVAIVPRGIPFDQIKHATESMRRVNELILDAGGKRYLTGWLPETHESVWQRHYGDRYEDWCAARHTYDPRGTFTSALFAQLDSG
jgi:cytokinin dehydrogenase